MASIALVAGWTSATCGIQRVSRAKLAERFLPDHLLGKGARDRCEMGRETGNGINPAFLGLGEKIGV